MTQEKADKIFSSEIGQQLSVIYVTSDDAPFIRQVEASMYAKTTLIDQTIEEWYPSDFLN